MTSIKFFDVKGVCKAPVIVRCADNHKVVVDDNPPCVKTPFHRFAGQEFATEDGHVLAIGEIYSRADRWNRGVTAAQGGTGESAGFPALVES